MLEELTEHIKKHWLTWAILTVLALATWYSL